MSQEQPVHRPPMPPFVFKYVMNPLMKALLSSPLHSRVSGRLLVLRFTGRKSGKRFAIPVGYMRQGKALFVFTHSVWHKNFISRTPVSVRVQGREHAGAAELIDDYETIKGVVHDFMSKNSKPMAQRLGLWVDDPNPSPEQLRQATAGTHFIRIQLND